MKDIDLLLPRVLEKAPACPEPTAIRHLRDAAIRFCRRTRSWRSTDTFTLPADGWDVLAVDPDAAIFELTSAEFDGADLDPVAVEWLDANRGGWRDEEGPPRFITQISPDTVRVAPKATGSLTVRLLLEPSATTDVLPDWIVDKYAQQIAEGALGEILAIPGDFQALDLAGDARGRFNADIDHLASTLPKGQQRARRRAKAHFL